MSKLNKINKQQNTKQNFLSKIQEINQI
jgi:hypothetical protein